MGKSLKDIAQAINGKIIGDESLIINGVSGIKEARDGDITFLANPKYKPFIRVTHASAVITSKDIKSSRKTIIQTDNPSLAFTKVISMFMPQEPKHSMGISKAATIEEDVVIGENTTVYPNCYIGKDVKIGKDTTIHPNVTIREGTIIGNNVAIHSGSVIGSDGFGYVEVNGTYCKIPQVGIVVIEDDVEIGANATIDRARFGQTVIGKGTKIDNLVQIAHNVKIGANSVVVAQSGISGSATLGKNTILAGQSALVGHIELGDNVIVGPRSAVTKSFPANSIILGAPAKPIAEQKKIFACMSKLPELFNTLKLIKKKLNITHEETKDDKKTD